MKKFLIKVNGTQYEVEVEEVKVEGAKGTQSAPKANTEAPVKVAAKAGSAAPAASGDIVAPMPGTILNVNVNQGDQVKKGQVILILEAMKMENEITAPTDGVVTLKVEKGAAVSVGDVLASIA